MTVYDFVEFLSKGIDATRNGQYPEALEELHIAAQAQPDNPRVWLWLAAASHSLEEKRRFLENAAMLDPGSEMPGLLLARLDRSTSADDQKLSQEVNFICPNCGGKQRFDPDLGTLVCEYCHQTETLGKNNPAPAARASAAGNWSVGDNQIVCDACGARISIPNKQNTVCCPFCGSNYVIVQPASQDLIRPSSILPFQIHAGDIAHLLTGKKDRKLDLMIGSLQPIYLPFWRFSGIVRVNLALEYGVPEQIFSPVERVVFKGEWPEYSHLYELTLSNLVIYAGHNFNTNAISLILPFDLQELAEYRDEILAGWQAEFYQIALKDATVVAYRQMRDQAIDSAARRWIFIDSHKLLEDDVTYEDINSQLILLPVWVCHFKQGDQMQRALLNGQSGKGVTSPI
jgi:predicted RNA-binding Zn-ribbon protein involved in translation (DUF1610 family)